MAARTVEWYCDTCKEPITSAKDGYVEWLTSLSGRGGGHGVRIVHHRPASPLDTGCQYSRDQQCGASLSDDSLDHFVGPSGLMLSLSLIDEGFPMPELVEFWKRLHVNGYERARFHLQAAIDAGAIEPNLPAGYHWDKDIDAVLAWAQKTGRKP